jgi:hypothetical protein
MFELYGNAAVVFHEKFRARFSGVLSDDWLASPGAGVVIDDEAQGDSGGLPVQADA